MRKVGYSILVFFLLAITDNIGAAAVNPAKAASDSVMVMAKADTAKSAAKEKGSELDVKGMIFEHISDAYTWHIITIGKTRVEVNLPVIVCSKERGWFAFFSGKLHNSQIYDGFYIAREGKYEGKVVEVNSAGQVVRPLDFSVTRNVFALLISAVILLSIILSVARWYRKHPMEAPGGFTGMIEVVVEFLINDVVKANVGPEYKRFQPYLMTVFFFILINNLLGLIPIFPGGSNVTGNIAVTFVLAMFTMVIVNVLGSKKYWKEIFWPEVPVFLKVPVPLMPVIEIFGVISKPFSLMIRLFANVMAGHTIMLSLVSLIFVTVSMGAVINTAMTALSVTLSVFMFFVEILVSFLQAYIFTLLSSVYIGLARVK